ncbi:MAG: hypothetical protein WBA68_01405 [Alteraurantiacibacter sp.]
MLRARRGTRSYRSRWLWPLGGVVAALAGAAIVLLKGRGEQCATPMEEGGKDDLTRIKGIGPTLERRLNRQGVTRFAQIASWNADDIAVMDAQLKFAGRIERDNWVEQAQGLA